MHCCFSDCLDYHRSEISFFVEQYHFLKELKKIFIERPLRQYDGFQYRKDISTTTEPQRGLL